MSQVTAYKFILQRHVDALMQRPNVVGVAIGDKLTKGETTHEVGITVMVRVKLPKEALVKSDFVPFELEGVETDVIEVGDIRIHASTFSPADHQKRHRPVVGGISVGHFQITAGTLGAIVDSVDYGAVMLSNNHVLAKSNDAQIGDAILQPGTADGGKLADDRIGELAAFVPIQFGTAPPTCPVAMGVVDMANASAHLFGRTHRLQAVDVKPAAVNQVDAAIALFDDEIDYDREILEIGMVSGEISAELDMSVRKSGRTTGLTVGKITLLEATVSVNYGGGKMATFENQIITGGMSAPGDSGSLLVDANAGLAVGLLFAGSEIITIYNRIQDVTDLLSLDI